MSKKTLIYLLLAVVLIQIDTAGIAQQQTQDSGYFIDTKGDTTFGNFLISKTRNLYEVFTFRAKGNDTFRDLTASDAKEFSIARYGRFIAKDILEGSDKRLSRKFLLILEDGAIKFYIYTTQLGKLRYFIESNGKLLELERKEVVRQTMDGTNQTRIADIYKGTLAAVFKDCPQPVDRLSFYVDPLLQVVNNYNRCKDPGHPQARKGVPTEHPVAVRSCFWVSPGATSITMGDFGFHYSSASLSIAWNLQIELTKNFRLQTGLDYLGLSWTSSPNSTSQGVPIVSSRFSQLAVPVEGMIFTSIAKNTRLFGSAGICYSVALHNEINMDYNFFSQFSPPVAGYTGGVGFGAAGGAGITYQLKQGRELILGARFQNLQLVMSPGTQVTLRTVQLSLGITGVFGKHKKSLT